MKKLILLLFVLSFISLASASPGVYKQGDDINLIQICADCSFVNITSVIYPNGSIIVSDVEMTKTGSRFNYTLISNYTDTLGTYKVNGVGNPSGTNEVWAYDIIITYTGNVLSSQSATFYLVLFGVVIFLFLMTIFFINKLPSANTTDPEGQIMSISFTKYIRSTLWFVLWIFIVAILYISTNLSFAYLEDTLIANFFFVLFRIAFGLTLPIVTVWFTWIFFKVIDDRKIKRYWERGFFPGARI